MSLSWITNGDTAVDRATYIAAAGAATNWVWWPWLEGGLQLLLTILGIVWLGVQIYMKIKYRPRD